MTTNISTNILIKTRSQSGQIVVEYLLVLSVVVVIAYLIMSVLIGQGKDPGLVIKTWSGILKVIAQDHPDVVQL